MEQQSSKQKLGPPTLGLSIAADFWLWGDILILAPTYFAITSGWRIPFFILGFISLTISFGGALIEIGKLRKSEGLSIWGVSLVFIVPAIVLFLLVYYGRITGTLAVVSKVAILLLTAVGGPLFFQGIPYFFGRHRPLHILPNNRFRLPPLELCQQLPSAKPTLRLLLTLSSRFSLSQLLLSLILRKSLND